MISALGMFGAPVAPDIPGLDRFAGTIFHSARWDDDHDLTGEAVAVIGSAASAVQLVPEIAPIVGQLDLYQRSANWVLPKEDDPFTDEQLDDVPQRRRRDHRVARRDLRHRRSQPDLRRPGAARVGRGRRTPQHRGRGGSGGAEEAHAQHAVRLQAAAGVERLLPDVQPPQRRAGDRADHGDHRARGRHRRRPVPSGRHHHPRHRLRDHQVPRRARRRGPRRGAHRRRVGRRPPGVPRHHHQRASRTCSCCTGRTPTTARSST